MCGPHFLSGEHRQRARAGAGGESVSPAFTHSSGGSHGPKYRVQRQGSDPPGRAQALLDDSSSQSSMWLLWASPKFPPGPEHS